MVVFIYFFLVLPGNNNKRQYITTVIKKRFPDTGNLLTLIRTGAQIVRRRFVPTLPTQTSRKTRKYPTPYFIVICINT